MRKKSVKAYLTIGSGNEKNRKNSICLTNKRATLANVRKCACLCIAYECMCLKV